MARLATRASERDRLHIYVDNEYKITSKAEFQLSVAMDRILRTQLYSGVYNVISRRSSNFDLTTEFLRRR